MAHPERPTPPKPLRERRKLRVLVSGASGFIGAELCRQLLDDGHTVLRLVRRAPTAPNEFNWAPAARMLDSNLIDSVDAVINLSGSPIHRVPWTPAYRKDIAESRIRSTQALAAAMNMASTPPAVFLSASGTSFYGDHPGVRLTEQSARGTGFLAELSENWEGAAHLAPAKTRVVNLRSGLVIGRGGVLSPLHLLTRLGLGARIGTGGQHWPWISRYDEAAAIRHLLTSKLSGPVNLVGPIPATAHRVTTALARSLHRWHPLVVPEGPIRLLGEGALGLLGSQKVVPERLISDGFEFTHKTVDEAAESIR